MAGYDNSRYTYENVLKGNGYYQQDSELTYSEGVKTMQEKLNKAGFWCDTPDGKFGSGTNVVVRNFQETYGLTVDGKAGKATLLKLDEVSDASSGFDITSGSYGVYFDSTNKRFMHNQQVVYECLKNAGLRNIAIAGFMGNFQVEHAFKTSMAGLGGAVGLVQWGEVRKTNLENYAKSLSKDVTSIIVQANFILEECEESGSYKDGDSITCFEHLKDTNKVKTVQRAADCVTAHYERCEHYDTWDEVLEKTKALSHFSKTENECDTRYYRDTLGRRGYAKAYYDCICKM